MRNRLKMIKVDASNITLFSQILCEAASWLHQKKQPLWEINDLSPEQLLQNYSYGEMYVAYLQNKPAGTVIIQDKDPLFWPGAIDDALYIHKLSIRRSFASDGVSSEILQWVKKQAVSKEVQWVRLDCASDRRKLRNFYEKNGFSFVKEIKVLQKYETALYQYKA
ncbi:GNAT family N-acetyltransferase [Alkalihalobacillus trypoxylicola]|uniref:N-acetyltransferase domain-containing protein n=1 Tax=Alkalihalobacillus trypoxylicola TaxID=519424 RepID=A0A162E7L6_9BACI|nr:GNAT family N-acetyltransferase [Alkalihalobacillus trypoxylicola]KYG31972.1 hypothetical protein AZF04_04135 [Alkalihalobacillus trypoxylicola]